MTDRELVGQHMIVGLSGPVLTSEEKAFLVRENIGGVILFSRNVKSAPQVQELCRDLQSLSAQTKSRMPFFISVDMEGGRVARMREPFTVWPPLRALGQMPSTETSYAFAKAMGLELRSAGVNLDYAPCLDIFNNPKNTVIGDRAIGSTPEDVVRHVEPLLRGYAEARVISCAKHFPGHGHTLIDSHEDLPVASHDLARLHAVELLPFKEAIRCGAELIMTAHILFPHLDKQWPATLSEYFLKTLLRRELGYRGLITTDDLDMKALAKNYDRAEIPVRALEAGVDLLLYCNEPESPPRALVAVEAALASGRLKRSQLENSLHRIHTLKAKYLVEPLVGETFPQDWHSPAKHRELAQDIRNNSAKT